MNNSSGRVAGSGSSTGYPMNVNVKKDKSGENNLFHFEFSSLLISKT